MQEPYAAIHHFKGDDKSVVDDDGDPMLGWYFQLMETDIKPMSSLTGPYGSHGQAETAALQEWAAA